MQRVRGCPFYAARQRVKDADLVIANHDLVPSALKVETGSVLPPAAETIYVFDEAHSLAAKVVEHFSAKHALKGASEWVERPGGARGRRADLKTEAAAGA